MYKGQNAYNLSSIQVQKHSKVDTPITRKEAVKQQLPPLACENSEKIVEF